MVSWLGSGNLGGKDWYLTDYTFVVKHEDLVSHREALFSTCSEFVQSGWYTAVEVRALVKESEKSIKAANDWDAARAEFASEQEVASIIGDRPMVIQTDRLEERVIVGASIRLPEQNKWPGPCIRCSTEEQRAEERSRQECTAFEAHCKLCEFCTTTDACSDVAGEHQPQAYNHGHHGKHSITYLPTIARQEAPAPEAPEPDAQHATKSTRKTARSTQYAAENLKKQKQAPELPQPSHELPAPQPQHNREEAKGSRKVGVQATPRDEKLQTETRQDQEAAAWETQVPSMNKHLNCSMLPAKAVAVRFTRQNSTSLTPSTNGGWPATGLPALVND